MCVMRTLLILTVVLGAATGCNSEGTCEYRYDQASSDNSIPKGLEVCVDHWVEDKCSEGALSSATVGLRTSGYTFTKGSTCTSRGFRECDAGRGTFYKVCPDELAKLHPLEKAPEREPQTEADIKPEPTSLSAPIAVPADAPFRGAADGKIVLQVFGDFEDPFTARTWKVLTDAVKTHPDLKIVFRHNPLRFHKKAPLAHQAAVEAFVQKGNDGFWAMSDLIMADRNLDRAALVEDARKVGLDVAAFEKALDGGTHAARVDQDAKAIADAGFESSPIQIIDTRVARGQLTPDRLDAFIAGK
jgi:protein-disulfide isomerase